MEYECFFFFKFHFLIHMLYICICDGLFVFFCLVVLVTTLDVFLQANVKIHTPEAESCWKVVVGICGHKI